LELAPRFLIIIDIVILEEALVIERTEGREEDVKKLLKFGVLSPEQISQALDAPLETVVQYRGEL
jgi:hypothetical protein